MGTSIYLDEEPLESELAKAFDQLETEFKILSDDALSRLRAIMTHLVEDAYQKGKAEDNWYNNAISKKLHEDYPHDFSMCDIDTVTRCHYANLHKKRMLFFEVKNSNEGASDSQLLTLKILEELIKWEKLDSYSGVYLLRIVDIDEQIDWYRNDKFVRSTTMDGLYDIVSCKV